MTVSIWRYAHLALAIISFLFLTMASVTGVILAFDPIIEKAQPYKIAGSDELTLAQTLPNLKSTYPEIFELVVDHHGFVTLEGMDEDGNDVKQIINPETGESIGDPLVKSELMETVTALHRSLFLKETGRFMVGVVSFLLLLIALSGTVLILKRQKGIRHFFDSINKDSFAQYFHVVSGRILLIPIIILALTGTYLFLLRFEFIPNQAIEPSEIPAIANAEEHQLEWAEFDVFRTIKLKDVEKVEFPFMEDPEEFFTLKLRDRALVIDQFTGQILQETPYPIQTLLEKWSLDLHTGRTSIIWAIIIGIASLNILFFIYSGFVISWKRLKNKMHKNKCSATEAETILLVGSENGSTLHFANKIYKQLQEQNQKVYFSELNQYSDYPEAKELIIFTSTFGLGDAPTNANQFLKRLNKIDQSHPIDFTVVGFGSDAYEDFCGFAKKVDEQLREKPWANPLMPWHAVNDKSPQEFVAWVQQYNDLKGLNLATTAALYAEKLPKLKRFTVKSISPINEEDQVFKLRIKTTQKFDSGDLLAIYPAKDHRERLYSIGKIEGEIQLVVKRHPHGLGSNFLAQLKENDQFEARLVENKTFHLPRHSKAVVLIANGTGIAPFLGMIANNMHQRPMHLYAGFRYLNQTTRAYQAFTEAYQNQNLLTSAHFSFSREQDSAYVMDIVRRDAEQIAEVLASGGSIMICGSLAMQRDVEGVLEEICQQYLNQNLESFKGQKQILTDCY
ncbi:PepSY domain-containing protein [Vaginella massiliensis]|uniref:PepSY domain-containing protein n=1 Tax=Vaginella massiliensis TaxID=1816680 RepID=UPI003752F773